MSLREVALALLIAFFASSTAQNVFICNRSSTKMVEFSVTGPTCQVHTDRSKIASTLDSDGLKVTTIDDDSLERIAEPCRNRKRYGIIYPGTLWCGDGTKATNATQLGVHSAEDSCCREHDNCPSYLESGRCSGGICNDSPFTRSHCDCDLRFQECLRSVGSETANLIGFVYFNLVRVVCYTEKRDGCGDTDRIVRGDGNEICGYEFVEAERYRPSVAMFTLKQKKAFFVNYFLRKLKLLR